MAIVLITGLDNTNTMAKKQIRPWDVDEINHDRTSKDLTNSPTFNINEEEILTKK